MNESGTGRSLVSTAKARPRTVEQLLDREEALATQRISESLQLLGEDLCRATDLRERIRRRPFLAAGLGACLGFLGGPLLLRAFQHVLRATSSIPIPIPGARPPFAVPGLVLASLRSIEGRR